MVTSTAMSPHLKPIPVRKHRSHARRALEGTAVAVILLGGLEVVLHVIAEGDVSVEAKLCAEAIALGLGVVVAGLRRR